ncbi:MAG: hypothetical protein IPO91_28895 [Chloroflexi bacterium]|nr:hypothetical protein [Chloroflexota bacterium]
MTQKRNDKPYIGVWGPTSSGKTSLIASALAMLESRIWVPTADGEKEYYGVEATDSDENAIFYLNGIKTLLQTGQFPVPTPTTDHERPLSLSVMLRDVHKDGRIGRYHHLVLSDTGGEMASNTDSSSSYWQDLKGATAILFVIDGDPRRRTFNLANWGYPKLIQNFIQMMGGRDGLREKYLAVCITKADLNHPSPAAALRQKKDGYQALLRSIVGDSITPLLASFTDTARSGSLAARRFEIFLTSASGWIPDHSENQWRSNTVEDNSGLLQIDDYHSWRSYQAARAFLWLFDQIEADQIYRHRLPFLRDFTFKQRRKNLDILKTLYASDDEYFP